MFQQSIEHGQQRMHTRGQRDFFDVPCGEEPLLKRFALRVVARGDEGPHWASGSGRGVGRITAAQGARVRASHASVCANWPVARAPSRACRGPGTRHPRAPGHRWLLGPSGWGGGAGAAPRGSATSRASLATAQRAPAGRRALSHRALATSIPPTHGLSRIRTPVHPTLQIRAQGHTQRYGLGESRT